MRVLTIYAHHNPRSFCHAVLERFTEGLRDAGHTNELVDLHAIRFNPVFNDRDSPDWVDDSVPDDVLTHWQVKKSLMAGARNPLRRILVKRWIGNSDERELVRRLHALGPPRDVAEQQAKVASADALAFVAPVYFVGFPAILKGWIERVFSLGFAFGMTADAWRGDVASRIPLLTHEKALILQTTIWDEASYDAGLKAAMKVLIDEYALRFPGVKRVEHEYFHAVNSADEAKRRAYLNLPARPAQHAGLAVDAAAGTARALRWRSTGNVLRMGHCAPTILQTLLAASGTVAPRFVKLAAGLPGGMGHTGGECGGVTAH